jgi:hypothetical protein
MPGIGSRLDQLKKAGEQEKLPRTATVDFVLHPTPRQRAVDLETGQASRHHRRHYSIDGGIADAGDGLHTTDNDKRRRRGSVTTTGGERLVRTSTNQSQSNVIVVPARERGFGGFPGPHRLLARGFKAVFPQLEQKLTRTLTIPPPMPNRQMTYVSFEPRLGRNSEFHGLTTEELEELGGVEYRALNVLLWLVGIVSYLLLLPFPRLTDYS